jgi:glyoxylase-like metal-dependent hydrolase (beta-lactamase superfamily II)
MTGVDAVERLAPYLARVLAPNPGPMTLEGTNTWLVGDPAVGAVLVVDPGPALSSHQDSVLAGCGGPVAAVVLTHRHEDHAAGAADLARRAGCGVRAADPALQLGPEGLVDGSTIAVGGATVTVVATPGHTSDSCSLLLSGDDGVVRLLTGDTVLGRGTTVIAAPDGDVGAYLGSLATLRRLVDTERVTELLPGHGPRVEAPAAWLDHYRRHREERLDQVRAAVAAGADSVDEVVSQVYAGIDPAVRPAAEQSVRAQLAYLLPPHRSA